MEDRGRELFQANPQKKKKKKTFHKTCKDVFAQHKRTRGQISLPLIKNRDRSGNSPKIRHFCVALRNQAEPSSIRGIRRRTDPNGAGLSLKKEEEKKNAGDKKAIFTGVNGSSIGSDRSAIPAATLQKKKERKERKKKTVTNLTFVWFRRELWFEQDSRMCRGGVGGATPVDVVATAGGAK